MMLIHEVCKKCNLTKKAIEYYGEQGLISPAVTENGYRQFSDDDVEKLKKIAVMRGLGLSVADIRVVLKDNSQSALLPMLHKKELEIATMKEKQEIMQRLVNSGDWEAVQLQMEALQSRQSILTRILDKFPGGYGRLVCMHFAPFLSEPIQTEDQQQAYETIISFWMILQSPSRMICKNISLIPLQLLTLILCKKPSPHFQRRWMIRRGSLPAIRKC